MSRIDSFIKGAVYDSIACLLPIEGRDYTLSINTEGKITIKMKGVTEIGIAFASYVEKELGKELQKRGFKTKE